MKKVNVKRLFLSIMILIIIIVAIVLAFKYFGSDEELNGENNGIDSQENVNTGNASNDVGQNEPEAEEDDNKVYISQGDTESVSGFVDESGNKLEGDSLQNSKDTITAAFKAVPSEKLGLTVDLNTSRLVFNEGITTIAEKECFVFNVYAQDGEMMKNVGTYAMSRDTEVLYKYNASSLKYELIEK